MPNQVLPSDSHAVVDMTMNCSITINMVRLPLGDHPATAVGLGKTVRTIYMTAMTGTVRDYEFSRAAAEKATANALMNYQSSYGSDLLNCLPLKIEPTRSRIFSKHCATSKAVKR